MKIYIEYFNENAKDLGYRKHVIEHIFVTIRMLRRRFHDHTEIFENDEFGESVFSDIFPEFFQNFRQTISIYGRLEHYDLVAPPFTLMFVWEHDDLKNLLNGVSLPKDFPLEDFNTRLDSYKNDKDNFSYIGTYDTTKDDEHSLNLDGEPLNSKF